jgi:inosine-uridine nucleoside N-ribohydrolase
VEDTRQLVVDTDVGVDDAAAIAWLLSQTRYPVEVLGFGTVAGNNSLENVTNNLLTVLDALSRPELPVVMGAAAPLTDAAIRMAPSVHGPDGLWGAGQRHPDDLRALPRNVPAFYRDLAETHPGATLVALGPLTNLALALEHHPEAIRRFGRLVILGGAWRGGNVTPVAEFNVWHDAEAAARVLASGLPIDLVTLDAFRQFTVEAADVERLEGRGTAVARLLAAALRGYLVVKAAAGRSAITVPDVAAVMYALDETLGRGRPGLVRVVTDSPWALGQTVMALEPWERPALAVSRGDLCRLAAHRQADPGFDYFAAVDEAAGRVPDNARIVLEIDGVWMRRLFMEALTGDP